MDGRDQGIIMQRQFHTRGGCGGMVSLFLIAVILTGLWVLMA